jgi:hypothetical protein
MSFRSWLIRGPVVRNYIYEIIFNVGNGSLFSLSHSISASFVVLACSVKPSINIFILLLFLFVSIFFLQAKKVYMENNKNSVTRQFRSIRFVGTHVGAF